MKKSLRKKRDDRFRKKRLTMNGQQWMIDFIPVISEEIRPLVAKDHPYKKGEYDGIVDYPRKRILIATKNQREAEMERTILHELFHLALPFSFDVDEEERLVRRLEDRLYPILRRFGLKFL